MGGGDDEFDCGLESFFDEEKVAGGKGVPGEDKGDEGRYEEEGDDDTEWIVVGHREIVAD